MVVSSEGCSDQGCLPSCPILALSLVHARATNFFECFAADPTFADQIYSPIPDRKEKDLGLNEKENTAKGVKPELVCGWLTDLLLPQGGVLLDPFLGTGSTGIPLARAPEGRGTFIGIEQEPVWLDLAARRLAAAREEQR